MFYIRITLNEMRTVRLFCLYVLHMLLYHAAIITKKMHVGWHKSLHIQNPVLECLVCLSIPISIGHSFAFAICKTV